MKKISAAISAFILPLLLFSQQPKRDSLISLLKHSAEDTSRVNVLLALAKITPDDRSAEEMEYLLQALELSNKLGFKSGIGKSSHNMGLFHRFNGELEKSISAFNKAISAHRDNNDKMNLSRSLDGLASTYAVQGNYPMALENYLAALKIREEMNDKEGIAGTSNNIGLLYNGQGNHQEALKKYYAALKINTESGNKNWAAKNYNNIAGVYNVLKDHKEALKNDQKALEMRKELNDLPGLAVSYNNIGLNHEHLGNYSVAAANYDSSLSISTRLNNKDLMAMTIINLGGLYIKQKDYKKSGRYLTQGLAYAKEVGHKEWIQNAYKQFSLLNSAEGDFQKAYENYQMYIVYRDSLANNENTKKMVQSQMRFEFDKQQAADSVRSAEEKKVIAAQLNQERTQRFALYGGLALVLVFSGFIFNRFKVTQKQKIIIESQKHQVEEKQKEIIDSMTYAKRLQDAILPPAEYVRTYIQDHFILYRPKDIVAGDFYWMEHLDGCSYIAAADSTGHGIPGAMVSVVCSNALNRAVKEFGLRDPGHILDKTRELVLDTFSKSDTDVKDGMDISLLKLDHANNTAFWAGANNSLWFVADKQVHERKADKQPIGRTENPRPFTTHAIPLKPFCTFYLFTDGFADQFGGPKGKKFMYSPLKELLLLNADLSLEDQKKELTRAFEHWIGKQEQVDDVTIIGLRC